MDITAKVLSFLQSTHPYDVLPKDELAALAGAFSRRQVSEGSVIYAHGDLLEGLYLIK